MRVTEIFYSLQGETRTVGRPTVFIRLTGCPLRCQYCDTQYAFHGGKPYSIEEILAETKKYKTQYVTVTGGEPLAQPDCIPLLKKLCDDGYEVSLETSGALDISAVDSRVVKILDIKTPGSREDKKNRWENLNYLLAHDQIKFVLCHQEDYHWAKKILEHYQLSNKCEILFSPSYHDLSADLLADWILHDQLPVRLQIQLHKYLWGEVAGK